MAFDDKTGRADVSAVPLYQQVMDDLKGEIARGVYVAGSRIPSEMELAKSYGVGRITVRRAIEELSRAGYLNRQQGRGTFVCAPKLKRKIRQKGDVQSFTEGCAANDMVPGARLVSRTVVAATHEDAAFFGVEPGCELIVVERVRTADGIPVMLENNAFVLADHPYLQTLADKDLTDNSIFALVAEHSGRAPLKSDPCTVEIALAAAHTAPQLMKLGEPESLRILDHHHRCIRHIHTDIDNISLYGSADIITNGIAVSLNIYDTPQRNHIRVYRRMPFPCIVS